MLKRFPDWPERLAAFLISRNKQAFEWGKNDCALFACDVILEITGTDIAADFRGYSDASGAERQIARFGSLEALARSETASWQMNEIKPSFAQRGDLVLFASPLGHTLGIVSMDGISIMAPGPNGLEHTPISAAITAWRAG